MRSTRGRSKLVGGLRAFRPSLLVFRLSLVGRRDCNSFLGAARVVKPSLVTLAVRTAFSRTGETVSVNMSSLVLGPVSTSVLLGSTQGVREHGRVVDQATRRGSDRGTRGSFGCRSLFVRRSGSTRPLMSVKVGAGGPLRLPGLFGFLRDCAFRGAIRCFVLDSVVLVVTRGSSIT